MILIRSSSAAPALLLMLWLAGVVSALADSFITNTIDGVYSNAAAGLVVGATGQSNALIIRAGGRLDATSTVLGQGPEAHANMAWVTDPGSLWDNTVSLTIGQSGSANSLVLTNGARVNGMRTSLGLNCSSVGNRAVITGAGTIWTCYGGLCIGQAGISNEVQVLAGGKIYSSGTAAVGWMAPARCNRLLMSGPGSGLAHSGSFAVGSYGAAGNWAWLSAGASLYSVHGAVGNGPDNYVWLTDPGTAWQLDSMLLMGRGGSGNLLVLSNGARLLCSSAVVDGTSNAVVVTGPSTLWDSGLSRAQLVIGETGPSNRLVISQGGRVTAFDAYISGSSNQVLVTGPDSRWQVGNLLSVGEEFGRSNSLLLTDGAQVTCFQAVLAGDGGLVTITGPGSAWCVTDLLSVGGDSGGGNQLNLSAGAQLSSRAGYVGGADTAFDPHGRNVDNAVHIAGAGSVWSNAAELVVGSTGSRSRLVVAEGGSAVSARLYVGYYSSSSDNVLWLTDSSSRCDVAGDVWVGYRGWRNHLVVTNGARLASAGGWISGRNARGNAATVTGPDSAWQVTGSLVVGNGGWTSQLEVRAGGQVSCAALFLDSPYEANPGISNAVVVSGTNSVLAVAGTVTVGASSSVNELRVEAGGSVQCGSLLVGSPNTIDNRVVLADGTLVVTNLAGSGTLELRRAALVLDQGRVCVDRLVADAQAKLTVAAGELVIARATSLASTQAVEVGLAGEPVNLWLRPGTHTVAGGLVVGSNAMLTAAGKLVGNLDHAGTLQIGPGTDTFTVGGDLRLHPTAVVVWELGGPERGTEADFLRVSNTVSFDGLLQVELVGGFVPPSNAVITLMEYGAAESAFANAPHGSRISLLNSIVTAQVDYGSRALRLLNFENAAPATDQIDPAWALRYFGHRPLTEEEQRADPDGDGLTNLQEYLAGTDPLDPTSLLKIVAWACPSAGVVLLQFPCGEGRAYSISVSSDLTRWHTIWTPTLTQPTSGVCLWVDDGTQTAGLLPGSPRFYRICVR
jgi:T5SS/PEP-CTERM-associated repeat protein